MSLVVSFSLENYLRPKLYGRITGKVLKFLELSNNDLSELPAGLGYLPSLQQLGVDGNRLRSVRRTLLCGSTEALKAYLRTRGPAPPSLSAEGAEGGVGAPGGGAGAGPAAVSAGSDQAFLHLVRDALSSGGVLALCGARKDAGARRHAAPGGGERWSEEALAALLRGADGSTPGGGGPAAALADLPAVKLRLCFNGLVQIGPELSRSLSGMANLSSVDLSDNSLSALPTALAALPALEDLAARNNQLEDGGLTALASALRAYNAASREGCRLRVLDLGQNRLTVVPSVLVREMSRLEARVTESVCRHPPTPRSLRGCHPITHPLCHHSAANPRTGHAHCSPDHRRAASTT